jgi:Neocarzinostatin family
MSDLGTRADGAVLLTGWARARTLRRLLAAVTVGGGLALLVGATAYGAATMTITPSTGLSAGQTVTITGSGFHATSIGNFLECNSDPNQPQVNLPAPVSNTVAVGCIAPSYHHVVTTGADGSLNGTFAVLTGTIGPPCGTAAAVITTCPATDSTGGSPAADAAKYPCPPTPAQLAAGDTCQISYGDQANDAVTLPIHFASEQAATPTTVAAPVTTTPAAAPVTTAPVTSPGAPSLATTGAGPGLWLMALAGALLTGAGALLWLAPVRRLRRNGRT